MKYPFKINHLGSPLKGWGQTPKQILPAVYRQCAVSYTDFWEAYEAIFPAKRHLPVGKETGKTLDRLGLWKPLSRFGVGF
jgi:IS1 family transposase